VNTCDFALIILIAESSTRDAFTAGRVEQMYIRCVKTQVDRVSDGRTKALVGLG